MNIVSFMNDTLAIKKQIIILFIYDLAILAQFWRFWVWNVLKNSNYLGMFQKLKIIFNSNHLWVDLIIPQFPLVKIWWVNTTLPGSFQRSTVEQNAQKIIFRGHFHHILQSKAFRCEIYFQLSLGLLVLKGGEAGPRWGASFYQEQGFLGPTTANVC